MAYTEEILYANNANSTLASGIAADALTGSVQIGDGALFPSPGAGQIMVLTLEKSTLEYEIVKCTGRSTDTMTWVRAQEGTSPLAFSAGDKVELRLTRDTMNAIPQKLQSYDLLGLSLVVGSPTGGNKGAGTGNFAGLVYVNNVQLARVGSDETISGNWTYSGAQNFTGLVKFDGVEGVAGQVLTGNGAGNTPTFQSLPVKRSEGTGLNSSPVTLAADNGNYFVATTGNLTLKSGDVVFVFGIIDLTADSVPTVVTLQIGSSLETYTETCNSFGSITLSGAEVIRQHQARISNDSLFMQHSIFGMFRVVADGSDEFILSVGCLAGGSIASEKGQIHAVVIHGS